MSCTPNVALLLQMWHWQFPTPQLMQKAIQRWAHAYFERGGIDSSQMIFHPKQVVNIPSVYTHIHMVHINYIYIHAQHDIHKYMQNHGYMCYMCINVCTYMPYRTFTDKYTHIRKRIPRRSKIWKTKPITKE